MKRSRFSEEQIIGILKEQEAGMPTVELVVREQCVFAVRDEVIFAGLHGCRLRPLQVVIGTWCAIV